MQLRGMDLDGKFLMQKRQWDLAIVVSHRVCAAGSAAGTAP
jgi:hypothetical protein